MIINLKKAIDQCRISDNDNPKLVRVPSDNFYWSLSLGNVGWVRLGEVIMEELRVFGTESSIEIIVIV